MLPIRKLLPILSFFLLLSIPVSLRAYWPLDGACLSTAPYPQAHEVTVEDGAGGAIIVFTDSRHGNRDIFAQRVDRYGNIMWDPAGVPVCTVTGDQDNVDAVSDGSGGAVITWDDARGGPTDIYVQRLGPDGVRLWNTAGVSLCSAANDQRYPRIATDGNGGGIVIWEDLRSGQREIYARRVDSSGSVLWDIWGIEVYTGGSLTAYDHQIASDGEGGAILVWVDYREGLSDYNIYYNHVDSGGTLSWGGSGLVLCDAPENQYDPVLYEMGGEYVAVVWIDYRNTGSEDLYAKMIRWNGSFWGNGRQICSDPNSNITDFSIIGDNDSGLFVCWRELRDLKYKAFIQLIDFEGDLRWGTGGINISDPGYADDPKMVSDGEGGVIVSWNGSPGMGTCIMAQRIDANGDFLWETGGVKTSLYPYSHDNMGIIPDGRGGAVVVWADFTYDITDTPDLYAQHIDPLGYIASPEPVIGTVDDVPMDQGGHVDISWDASYLDLWPYQEITHYSVWKSLSPASATMIEENGIEYTDLRNIDLDNGSEPGTTCGTVIRRETDGAATYYWELIATQAAQYYEGYSKVVDTDFTSLETAWTYSYYQVAAHAADPLAVWTSQPDSGYSLDNLAPAAPIGLAGEQEYDPEGMDLIWNANIEGDLSHYVIYRGTDPSFIPSGTNMLASVCDTMYFDGGWTWEPGLVYKVSAVDIHQNESGYALLLPGDVTGDDPPTPAHKDYLSQNYPNPFNPSTTIQFGLKERGYVRLMVYDTSGRLVSELVNGTLPAGDHTEIWDGRNSSGQHVSSGVYFYKLTAGEFSTERKMILIR